MTEQEKPRTGISSKETREPPLRQHRGWCNASCRNRRIRGEREGNERAKTARHLKTCFASGDGDDGERVYAYSAMSASLRST